MVYQLSQDDFLEQAIAKHGTLYDYSETVYSKRHAPITIICRKHGPFVQLAHYHMMGSGCQTCGSKYCREDVIERFIAKFGNKFDYSEFEYKGMGKKSTIICPIHGKFEKSPNDFLEMKAGCRECGGIPSYSNEIIDNLLLYLNLSITRLGDFDLHGKNSQKIEWQCDICDHTWSTIPHSIFKKGNGCQKCSFYHHGASFDEDFMHLILLKYGFDIEYQYSLSNVADDKCRHRFDFYLPEIRTALEFNGKQHYQVAGFSSNIELNELNFEKQKERDEFKRVFCKKNSIDLMEIDGRKYKKKTLEKYMLEFIIPYLWIKYDLLKIDMTNEECFMQMTKYKSAIEWHVHDFYPYSSKSLFSPTTDIGTI